MRPAKLAAIALTMAISTAQLNISAWSAAVSFTPQPNLNGGAVIGRIPLEKLGNLTLPRGRAYFKSNMLEITAIPEYQFDRTMVLSGPILKCWSSSDGKNASVSGIAYFQDGDWLKYIDENTPDKVVTGSDVYTGQITAMKNGYLEVTPDGGTAKQIRIADVQQIVSPRAYTFTMPVTAFLNVPQGQPISGDTTKVSLKPTSRTIALALVKRDTLMQGDGDVKTKNLVALWAGISTVEVLQFLPLAILEGPTRRELVRQYHSRTLMSQQSSNFQSVTGALYQNNPNAPGANPFVSYPIIGQ